MTVKTKIICTLGPAASHETVLRKMMLAGMDVVRLNFSHGKPEQMIQWIQLIKKLNSKYRRRIKILGDLQGHRIRVGDLSSPIELRRRQTLSFVQHLTHQTNDEIPFDYQGSLDAIKKGHQIFIDDGNIVLEVMKNSQYTLHVKVITPGLLKSRKGINIPDANLDFGSINQQDIKDISFCQKYGVDYIAQSFVRTKKDILEVRDLLPSNTKIQIIAKIENREGIKNIDQILKVCDGIMIARGDMGVSLPIYEIPIVQKKIIKKCNLEKKFVITATQMLESMTDNLRPTRAEVTDVANAIMDGTNFVMLSGESAVGKYPVETVTMMNHIIKFTEKNRSNF